MNVRSVWTSAKAFFWGPVFAVGAFVSAALTAVGVWRFVRGDSFWMWAFFAALALVAASYLRLYRMEVEAEATAKGLPSRLDALIHEGMELVQDLSAPYEPQTKDGTTILLFGAAPGAWEKVESYGARASDVIKESNPALLWDFTAAFNASMRDQREELARKEAEETGLSDAEKLRRFAERFYHRPASVARACLDGVVATRRNAA